MVEVGHVPLILSRYVTTGPSGSSKTRRGRKARNLSDCARMLSWVFANTLLLSRNGLRLLSLRKRKTHLCLLYLQKSDRSCWFDLAEVKVTGGSYSHLPFSKVWNNYRAYANHQIIVENDLRDYRRQYQPGRLGPVRWEEGFLDGARSGGPRATTSVSVLPMYKRPLEDDGLIFTLYHKELNVRSGFITCKGSDETESKFLVKIGYLVGSEAEVVCLSRCIG